jgi:transcription antitermination factor NusG
LITPIIEPHRLNGFRVEPKWHALYTKGRHEKFVHSELLKRSIESFLPIRKIKRRWSDRTVSVEEPLFKSYVFVKIDEPHFLDALKVNGVLCFVRAGLRPVSVEEGVIGCLKRIVEEEIAMDPFPYLNTGDRIRVRGGLFQGVEGYVLRKDEKRCRLVISIDAIRASISVEVDSYLVEKV